MSIISRFIEITPRWALLAFAIALITLNGVFVGCSQFSDSVPATTAVTHTASEIILMFPGHPVITGDMTYAEINPAFLPAWQTWTGRIMSLLGLGSSWSPQFDCNRFATLKMAAIYGRFLVDTFHDPRPAQSPAAGEFWYVPAGSKVGHAILVTIQGGKKVYVDVYSEKVLTLTKSEEESVYLIKF